MYYFYTLIAYPGWIGVLIDHKEQEPGQWSELLYGHERLRIGGRVEVLSQQFTSLVIVRAGGHFLRDKQLQVRKNAQYSISTQGWLQKKNYGYSSFMGYG